MTSTPAPPYGEATLDKPLMVPRGASEQRFQSVCKWTRDGARCLAYGTAFNNFHNAVLIGGLAGFEPQRQSTSTPHVACDALHISVSRDTHEVESCITNKIISNFNI